jgi:hypothetical protein
MDTVFIIPIATTLLFFVIKFIEIRYFRDLDSEPVPLKNTFRDSLIVFIVSLVSGFIFTQLGSSMDELFSMITDQKMMATSSTTEVFTGQPNF